MRVVQAAANQLRKAGRSLARLKSSRSNKQTRRCFTRQSHTHRRLPVDDTVAWYLVDAVCWWMRVQQLATCQEQQQQLVVVFIHYLGSSHC
jgi:hypothetical protein